MALLIWRGGNQPDWWTAGRWRPVPGHLVLCQQLDTLPRLHRLESTAALKGEGQATMQASEARRAMAAAMSAASSLDLTAADAIVLHDSNKLTLRLLPCDVLARVAPVAHQVSQFEVGLAQRLAESGCPVAALEPRARRSVAASAAGR